MKITLILLCSIFQYAFNTPVANTTALSINNLDFELGGEVRIHIFKKQAIELGLEMEPVEKLEVPIKKAPYLILPELDPGEYMIAVFHDSNHNGKMDFNFFGKPKEGFGFSGEFICKVKTQNPESHYIRLNAGSQEITINVCY